MPTLTKYQADFLFRVMRTPGTTAKGRSGTRSGNRLAERGLLETVEDDGLFRPVYRPSRLGLEALAYYWALKDAATGSIANMERRQEVDAALAARFPEPLKIAA